MKVEIIDSKDPAKMTIEDLAKRNWVGVDGYGSNDERALLASIDSKWGLIWASPTLISPNFSRSSKIEALITALDGGHTFHVFDTAKELFAWMAE